MCLYFKNLGLEKYIDKLLIKCELVYMFRYLNYLKMVIYMGILVSFVVCRLFIDL